jgi:hypothetical protein
MHAMRLSCTHSDNLIELRSRLPFCPASTPRLQESLSGLAGFLGLCTSAAPHSSKKEDCQLARILEKQPSVYSSNPMHATDRESHKIEALNSS